jgi:predicted ABC-type ATPase
VTGFSQPHLFVLAGPNGAGKTTVARVLLPQTLGIRQFVNADNIAAGLSPFAPETTAIQAGKLMLHRIRELMRCGEDFGFETTLAGRGTAALLREAKANLYQVHLIYIWLSSADLAVARVADRVRQGGHDVPEETIRRR